mmetsp:Transcript_19066/g.43293  ORF Transcript_19066/g.43293 Transcript_19066/m.43293 type:complete len:201 (+) Transcript_19066:354-956(+)
MRKSCRTSASSGSDTSFLTAAGMSSGRGMLNLAPRICVPLMRSPSCHLEGWMLEAWCSSFAMRRKTKGSSSSRALSDAVVRPGSGLHELGALLIGPPTSGSSVANMCIDCVMEAGEASGSRADDMSRADREAKQPGAKKRESNSRSSYQSDCAISSTDEWEDVLDPDSEAESSSESEWQQSLARHFLLHMEGARGQEPEA